jgi:hypothetical protein
MHLCRLRDKRRRCVFPYPTADRCLFSNSTVLYYTLYLAAVRCAIWLSSLGNHYESLLLRKIAHLERYKLFSPFNQT